MLTATAVPPLAGFVSLQMRNVDEWAWHIKAFASIWARSDLSGVATHLSDSYDLFPEQTRPAPPSPELPRAECEFPWIAN